MPETLADRIRSEAELAERPGQMKRLEDLANEVEKRLERDRRELWHLEGFLAVNGTTSGHHERRLRLYRYLCATCEHEWGDVSGWGGCPQGTSQCSWCSAVALPGERRPAIGALSSINEEWPRATPDHPDTLPNERSL